MSINVSFDGTSYSVPQDGEVGWASLTNYLVALANKAGTNTSAKQNSRIATTSPINIVSDDFSVISKLTAPGPVAVQLPAGNPGRLIVIVDGTGDASTNNITVTPFGSETINNASSFVIKRNSGSVFLQFLSGNWVTISSFSKDILSGDVVGTIDSQTLTNKTIDGDNNTLTDISISSLKTVLGDASKFIGRDSSGIVVSLKAVPTGDVVGTSDFQQLTNKDIDLGTASNSKKITISKNTKTNLDALTRKQGTVYYATDDGLLYLDDGSSLNSIKSSFYVSNQTKLNGETLSFDATSALQIVNVTAASPVTVLLDTTPTTAVQATIRGTSNSNTIAINYSSSQRINGPIELGLDDQITVLFDTGTSSWVEISRTK